MKRLTLSAILLSSLLFVSCDTTAESPSENLTSATREKFLGTWQAPGSTNPKNQIIATRTGDSLSVMIFQNYGNDQSDTLVTRLTSANELSASNIYLDGLGGRPGTFSLTYVQNEGKCPSLAFSLSDSTGDVAGYYDKVKVVVE